MKFCACGCGGEITQLSRPGWSPTYLKGHNATGKTWAKDDRPPVVTCACGCGTELKRSRYPSQQRTWVRGHQFIGMQRSVTYGWSRLPADLERLGSSIAVAEEIGVSQDYVWDRANRLGYSVTKYRNGTSKTGRLGEEIALRVLPEAEDMLHRGREPYDLRWRGQRINVKTAHPGKWGWSFNTARGAKNCDAFFLVALTTEDEPLAYWLIPSADLRGTIRTGLSDRGKYSRYRWRPVE